MIFRFVLSLGLCVYASSAWAGVLDRVVAVVNEDVITLSEVYDLGDQFIQQRCGRNPQGPIVRCIYEAEVEVLDSLISRSLVKQKLAEAGMSVTPEDVDRTINGIMRDEDIPDRDTFKKAVTEQGWDWSAYKKELAQQIRQMKFNQNFITPRVSVSDDEVKNVYNRTQRQFASNPKRKLEALSIQMEPDISDGDKAAIIAKLTQVSKDVNGGTLEWLAAIESHDSGVYKDRKGQMGSFMEGELIAELRSVFALETGIVSEPLVVANSVMLVKVVGEDAGAVKAFEDVKDQIRNQLFQAQATEEMEQWVLFERRKASVRVLLTEPKL
jgi:peptidyl-prolyl cis-trans isomerase SurA